MLIPPCGRPRARDALLVALLVALLAAACQPSPPDPALFDWVECADCQRDAYARVVALGTPAVPVLSDWLLNGPPIDRIANVRTTTERLMTGQPIAEATQAAIVRKQVADYTRQYQRRAAFALGGIGGSQALVALCRARVAAPSTLERAVLDTAVARTGGHCP